MNWEQTRKSSIGIRTKAIFCDVQDESGDMVLGISLDDGSQGSSGRLCNLNQVDQAEELYIPNPMRMKKISAITTTMSFCNIFYPPSSSQANN